MAFKQYFFSMVLATSLILVGRTTLVFSQIPNEKKLTDQSNINQNFNATLTGNQQIPSVKTKGFGTAFFELLDNNTILDYQISVLDIQNITEFIFIKVNNQEKKMM